MKHQTKQERCRDLFDTYRCIKKGVPIRRSMAKDSSIPTHPVVPVDPDKQESCVLAECLDWLRRHHIFCNRHDCGAGDFGFGYATYGIKNAGDIIGILYNGIHFEIETKAGKGGRLSKGQQKRMRDVRNCHAYYFVVHGVEELEYYFKIEGLI